MARGDGEVKESSSIAESARQRMTCVLGSENCSENSSGLLVVLGAPTTSESKGTRCQQSTFRPPPSPAACRSR